MFSSEWPKHHLLRESVVKKCYVLGYIHNSTNNKVWSTKARAAKKYGHLLGIHKRSLFYDMVYDGRTCGNYSGPLCSSLEVGMLRENQFLHMPMLQGLNRHLLPLRRKPWVSADRCCLLKSCHCRDKRERDSS